MDTTRPKRAEGRPTAAKEEVLTAVMDGNMTDLLLKKRVTLQMAEDVRAKVIGFLSQGGKEVDHDDPRLRRLNAYIKKQKKTGAQPVPRRVGEVSKYKARRNAQRAAPFAHIPLSVLERPGQTLNDVMVTFGADEIIIRRVK